MFIVFSYPKDIQFFFAKLTILVKNSENDGNSRRWGGWGGVGHVLCIIMKQCKRKPICDLPLICRNYKRKFSSRKDNISVGNFT